MGFFRTIGTALGTGAKVVAEVGATAVCAITGTAAGVNQAAQLSVACHAEDNAFLRATADVMCVGLVTHSRCKSGVVTAATKGPDQPGATSEEAGLALADFAKHRYMARMEAAKAQRQARLEAELGELQIASRETVATVPV